MRKIKKNIKAEISTFARNNLDKRLQKQGLSLEDMSINEYETLLKDEIEMLTKDAKNVGAGIAIGFAISMLTGF